MALKFGTSGIRGLNTEFTPLAVRAYIGAFIQHARSKTAVSKIAIAGDLRESTPGIQRLVEEALVDLGCEVLDCDQLPTPALALFCAQKQVPGVMITGSHIPADRNGVKFYWPWGEILKEDELAIMKNFELIESRLKAEAPSRKGHGPTESMLAQRLYIDRYTHFFSPYRDSFTGKKVVVYQHSAVSRDLWKPILSALGFEVIEVGRTSIFTPVDTETDEAVNALRKVFDTTKHADLFAVVSSDGDADRPFLCDEKLQMVRGDTIGILSSAFLKADCVVTPVSTNTALEKSGLVKKVLRTKIGSPFVIEGMAQAKEASVVVGFEANGGLLLGSDIVRKGQSLAKLPTRDSVLPVLCCLALAAEKRQTLSEVVTSLPARYTDSDLLREFPIEKKDSIFHEALEGRSFQEQIASQYGAVVEKNQIDGLRLTLASGVIVHFRPSGNAPEFRCYAEAATPTEARAVVKAGIQWLAQFR